MTTLTITKFDRLCGEQRRRLEPLIRRYIRAENPSIQSAQLDQALSGSIDYVRTLLAPGGVLMIASDGETDVGFVIGTLLRNNGAGFSDLTSRGISPDAFEIIALTAEGPVANEARKSLLAELAKLVRQKHRGADTLVMLAPNIPADFSAVQELGFGQAAKIQLYIEVAGRSACNTAQVFCRLVFTLAVQEAARLNVSETPAEEPVAVAVAES